jgi:hypothetical protein
MPHLITIIKYARTIVKYIVVLLSAVLETGRLASCASGTSGSFCLDWQQKWVRLVICDMVVSDRVGTGRRPAGCLSYLSYSMGKGASGNRGLASDERARS